MNVKVEKAGGLTRFLIEGDMSIYHAVDLKKCILENLPGSEAAEFDLNGVSDMDTAGAQLLMFALREGRAGKTPVRIIAHSSATKRIFDLYNLNGNF